MQLHLATTTHLYTYPHPCSLLCLFLLSQQELAGVVFCLMGSHSLSGSQVLPRRSKPSGLVLYPTLLNTHCLRPTQGPHKPEP